MKESKIEAHFTSRAKQAGFEVRKVQWLCRRGAPDRVVMAPGGMLCWVELKRPGLTAEPHQVREHARLTAMGQDVRVLDTLEAVDAFFGGWPCALTVH